MALSRGIAYGEEQENDAMSCPSCEVAPVVLTPILKSDLCPNFMPPGVGQSPCDLLGLGDPGARLDGPFPALAEHASDFSPATLITKQALWTPVQKIVFAVASILSAASNDVSAVSLNDTFRKLVISLNLHAGREYPLAIHSQYISAGKDGSNSADLAQVFQILNDTLDNQADQLTLQDRLSIAASFGFAAFGVESPVLRSLGQVAMDVFELWALNTALHGIASAGPQTLFGLEQAKAFIQAVLLDKGLDCCKNAATPSSDVLFEVALPLEIEVADSLDPTQRKRVQAMVVGKVPARPVGTDMTFEQWAALKLLGGENPYLEGAGVITTEDTQNLSDKVKEALQEAFAAL